MGLSPEKMEELKQKYGIDDKAIFEIADSLEPEAEAPEIPQMGNERTAPPTPGALPASLASAMRGDITIAEAIILMNYMDRQDERKERRYAPPPPQDTSNLKDLVNEIREERKAHQDQIERLILGKRVDDSEERAKNAEENLKKKEEAERQREVVEGAVRGAVGEIDQKYGAQLDNLASRIHSLPVTQQISFMDEISADFGTSLKDEFKTMILNRLKPPEKPITKTDEEGKKSIDWESLLDRGFKLADKYVETQKATPPKLSVKEIPTTPGAPPAPLAEGPTEAAEGPPIAESNHAEQEPKASPIHPQDLDGIGPERAKKLSELGITDARQLTKVSPGYLKDQLGVGKDKAEDIIKQAKELTEQA